MTFSERLSAAVERSRSLLCAGFDPVIEILPESIRGGTFGEDPTKPQEEYYASVLIRWSEIFLAGVSPGVAAVKPNLAFFEQYGIGGLRALQHFLRRAREKGLLTIGDAKRGDIDSTAKAYVNAFLPSGSPFECDALTVSPFLGFDTVRVFVSGAVDAGKGLYVLVRTSNPGARDLQALTPATAADSAGSTHGASISEIIGRELSAIANEVAASGGLSPIGAVVGATASDAMRSLRASMPRVPFLIPGVGAQGGGLDDALEGCRGMPGAGILPVSRGLLTALPPMAAVRDSLGSSTSRDAHDDVLAAAIRSSVTTLNNDIAARSHGVVAWSSR